MKWWRSAYEAQLEERVKYLEARAEQAELRCDYWQHKTERLLDMALFKRGEITAPVFEESKAQPDVNPMLRILGAMSTTETDSSKRASTAMPVTPMP